MRRVSDLLMRQGNGTILSPSEGLHVFSSRYPASIAGPSSSACGFSLGSKVDVLKEGVATDEIR